MYLRTYTYGTYVHACSYVNRPHGVGGRWRQRPPAVTRSQKWFYAMEAGEAGGFLLQHHVVLVVQTTYKQDRVAASRTVVRDDGLSVIYNIDGVALRREFAVCHKSVGL